MVVPCVMQITRPQCRSIRQPIPLDAVQSEMKAAERLLLIPRFNLQGFRIEIPKRDFEVRDYAFKTTW